MSKLVYLRTKALEDYDEHGCKFLHGVLVDEDTSKSLRDNGYAMTFDEAKKYGRVGDTYRVLPTLDRALNARGVETAALVSALSPVRAHSFA